MKEYKEHQNKPMAANESLATYGTRANDAGAMSMPDSSLMDELLHQSDEVKLFIIEKLSESMKKQDGMDETDAIKPTKRKEIEARLDELHVTGSLRRLFGAAPL